MLPVQSFMTLYLQAKQMDQRIRPRLWVTVCVFLIFFVQAILSAFIINNILFN